MEQERGTQGDTKGAGGMAVRDYYKDEAYFDAFIEGKEQLVEQNIGHLQELDSDSELQRFNRWILLDLAQLTLASYSRGDPMGEVARRGRRTLDFAKGRDISGSLPHARLRLASLVPLLIDDPTEEAELRLSLHNERHPDWATDLILGYDPASIKGEEVNGQTALRGIWEATGELRSDVLAKKFSRWYATSSDQYWRGFHKEKGRTDLYFGYWAVEFAAIARRLDIDDSALEGEKYYPYELAHWLDGKG